MQGKAEVLNADQPGLESAAKLIRDGRLVAFPTETVYGLGANALNESAVAAIFTLKRRPSSNPLIVHIEHIGFVEKLTSLNRIERSVFECLATSFWPGPLTIGMTVNIYCVYIAHE
jgi:L-threonylcarbamoyladenylate synthase